MFVCYTNWYWWYLLKLRLNEYTKVKFSTFHSNALHIVCPIVFSFQTEHQKPYYYNKILITVESEDEIFE